jgi:glucose/mannose transport system permease protein
LATRAATLLTRPAAPARGSGRLAWRLERWWPRLVLVPALLAAFLYVIVFIGWTAYVSLTPSTLLPQYDLSGFQHYVALWKSRRWQIAYTNLFVFGSLYVTATTALGLMLAIMLDQRIRAEALFRTVFLYPMAVSFVVTGTVWSWILNPSTGIEHFAHGLGWAEFQFGWIIDRDMAIYCVVMTAVWHSSGFAMALFLAGLRSVDQDLVKAAQIDGASMARIYRRIILPQIGPIFVAVIVIMLQFAIKVFDLVLSLTGGGPGIATNVPAIVVYDYLFQRGQIGQGAAAAMMIFLGLAVILVPYTFWQRWRAARARALARQAEAEAAAHG